MTVDWELIKQALEVKQINERAAIGLLFAAMDHVDEVGEEVAVVYGKDGYSDLADPRDPDCRDDKPDHVWLQAHINPDAEYRIKRIELIQEEQSCNVYFVVMNADGAMMPVMGARLGSPYSGSDKNFKSTWKAPASPDSIFMGPDSKFWNHDLGPLAGFLTDTSGKIISDVVGSMGLREGKHCSYRLYFERR